MAAAEPVQPDAGFVPDPVEEWEDEQRLAGEKETLGLFLTGHPIDFYEADIKAMASSRIARLSLDDVREARGRRGGKKVTVSFDGDGATLEARSVTTLDQVTSLLLSMDVMPKVTVQAWGGSKKVSEDRAKAVVAALTASGVPPELLEAVGKGSLPRGQTDVVRMLIAE